ncbi:MAG: glycosyltransferase [candidate division WOR-3 bacterium]|nr:MAG: glycosyltransferase [candidate division WOR-3 bacterium]
MKILIIVNALTYGGAEKQAVLDANMLAEYGHRVTIAYKNHGALIEMVSQKVNLYRISHQFMPLASLQLLIHLFHHQYDVIHCHLVWAAMISMIPATLMRQQYIFNEHGLGNWRRWYHLLAIRRINHFAAKVITPCKAVMNTIIEREGVDIKKVVVVYNSFEIERPLMSRYSAETGKKSDGFKIGFIGRFSPVKRLDILLCLAQTLKASIADMHFVLVGDGPERQKILAEVKKRNLNGYFNLPGFTADPYSYLKEFDVFILPSEREGFSLALLEAAAANVPAVAFDIGGNSEIIIDGVTGYLVPYGNVKMLVEKIVYLYKNNNARLNMGRTANAYARNRFSVAVRLEELNNLYKNL